MVRYGLDFWTVANNCDRNLRGHPLRHIRLTASRDLLATGSGLAVEHPGRCRLVINRRGMVRVFASAVERKISSYN
jgi:hypothetical protein